MRIKHKRLWPPSLTYGFIRGRQLDGTLHESPRVGSHIITAGRVVAGWGIVAEWRWPRLRRGDLWPPIEPPGLDEIAKFNRRKGYFRARGLTEIRTCLSRGWPVQVAMPIHKGWRSAPGGLILPLGAEPITDYHSIVLESVDESRQQIKFWNNWGPSWGDSGYGYLPYEYVERYVFDSWVFDLSPAPLPVEARAMTFPAICRRRAETNCLGHLWAQIDLWDVLHNVRTGWCFAVVREDRFEIEDFFLRPDRKEVGSFNQLVNEVRQSSAFFESPVTFWIPSVDTQSKSANFETVNNLIRAMGLRVKRSGVPWAAYRADQP